MKRYGKLAMGQKKGKTFFNRKYKDSVFRFLFGRHENRENLLALYNALNDSDYKNKDELRINTIEGVLSMNISNDVSFVLDSQMMLYEHQSTYNPNMPLRGLFYFSLLYQNEIYNEKSLYSPVRIKIPTPRFVVFYNGLDKEVEDRVVLKLSDSFEKPDISHGFEWTATMLNINNGHNREIMLKCKVLEEYALFIESVRKFLKEIPIDEIKSDKEKELEQKRALGKAVDECIRNGILRDFLKKNEAVVINMLYEEYDAQKEWKKLSKDFIQIGRESRQAEIDEANNRAYVANNRADEAISGQIKMISSMLSKGMTKEDIISLTGITEEKYSALTQNL